jgi:hypothetical protein
MNTRFDELTKSMAQSVTRRAALKKFGLGLAGLGLAKFGVNQAQAITGGVLDENAHPSVGGIVWRLAPRWPDLQPPVVCGSGALIHPRVFITAGHATDAIESYIAQGAMTLEDLRVSFASYAFESAAWQHVSGVLTHPGYANNATSAADVGVLILRDPVLNIPVMPLPPLGFLDAKAASGELKAQSDRAFLKVVGYGIDPGDANNGHLPFPPDGWRRSAQPEFQNLHDSWLYTDQKDSHDNGGSCNCDSGGAHFYVDAATGQETLVAVVSRGSMSVSHDYRVDTVEALSFLNAVLASV